MIGILSIQWLQLFGVGNFAWGTAVRLLPKTCKFAALCEGAFNSFEVSARGCPNGLEAILCRFWQAGTEWKRNFPYSTLCQTFVGQHNAQETLMRKYNLYLFVFCLWLALSMLCVLSSNKPRIVPCITVFGLPQKYFPFHPLTTFITVVASVNYSPLPKPLQTTSSRRPLQLLIIPLQQLLSFPRFLVSCRCYLCILLQQTPIHCSKRRDWEETSNFRVVTVPKHLTRCFSWYLVLVQGLKRIYFSRNCWIWLWHFYFVYLSATLKLGIEYIYKIHKFFWSCPALEISSSMPWALLKNTLIAWASNQGRGHTS